MIFQTHYNHARSAPEENHGPVLVERAGYIPAQQRIENLIFAGQRLINYRKEQFDFPGNEIDESAYDPTRSKNFDLSDAFILSQQLKERQKIRKDAVSEDVLSEPSQTAPKAPDGD